MDIENLKLDIEQNIEISATPEAVFEGLLTRLSTENVAPNDQPMPMILERKPGGRWFRDLGDDNGHLWGFVQTIKPPELLELYGQFFMSYPTSNHLAVRLTATDSGGTQLSLRHTALGMISDEHRQGVTAGWSHYVSQVKDYCEK